MSPQTFKLLLLLAMVLQNSSTVLVGRYTRAGIPKEDQYQVNHLILVCELSKFLASCALEYYTTGGQLIPHIQLYVLDRPMDALKITIPALLYLFQNTLLYVALANLTAPIFQVTYQFKLVTTALMSVVMLQRQYSIQQWVCLVLISLGVALVVLGEKKDTSSGSGGEDGEENNQDDKAGYTNMSLGLIAVTLACMSSALAGVYFEKVLKKKPATTGSSSTDETSLPPASLWMRNIQLAFYSVVIAAIQGWLTPTDPDRIGQSYLHGFNFWTWTLVLLQADGGLLVAAVIKYADNVLKGLATGVSVVLSSALSMLLFSTPLGLQFLMGGSLILSAVWFFSNPLPPQVVILLEQITNGGSSSSATGGGAQDYEMKGSLLPK
jgi:UDP-sugar transporter A1/2/3